MESPYQDLSALEGSEAPRALTASALASDTLTHSATPDAASLPVGALPVWRPSSLPSSLRSSPLLLPYAPAAPEHSEGPLRRSGSHPIPRDDASAGTKSDWPTPAPRAAAETAVVAVAPFPSRPDRTQPPLECPPSDSAGTSLPPRKPGPAHSNSTAAAAGKASRKRRRTAVVLPLPTLYAAAATSSSSAPPTPVSASGAAGLFHADEPPHSHLSQWLWGLLLTTCLAFLAAWDAKDQCMRYETAYALDQLVDDYPDRNSGRAGESGTQNSGAEDGSSSDVGGALPLACLELFDGAVVPATAATGILAVATLLWVRRVPRFLPPTARAGGLLLLSLGAAAAQTFLILSVMLRPRIVRNNENSGSSSSSSGSSYNPYQSLAAVDRYGRVGDNANLFFLLWISEALALALLYQTFTAFARLYWRRSHPTANRAAGARAFEHEYHEYDDDEEEESEPPSGRLIPSGLGKDQKHEEPHYRRRLLPATSWMDTEKSQLRKWYKTATLYRLRFRAGIWVATLVACLVIVASSHRLWTLVVVPNAGDTRISYVCSAQSDHSRRRGGHSAVSASALCRRTAGSLVAGAVGALLCATAVGMHLASRRGTRLGSNAAAASLSPSPQSYDPDSTDPFPFSHTALHDPHHVHRIPLATELVLSVLLSLLLGFNAVFSTGVQGPAATVGNLYFATWLAFFLCIRICLGCVEESQNLDHEHHPAKGGRQHPNRADQGQQHVDLVEKQRGNRLRSYFFLSIFSAVCGASAYDAAANQRQPLTQFQRYMVLAPCAVAAVSGALFFLCLSKRCYGVVSRFAVGGTLSVLCFGLWLAELVLTMHSDESWAVNGVGEIEVANLYFYSWAGILSAGFVMMSYVKALFQVEHTDYMSLVWIAVCKVCFVILGAALHIWHTIADNCEFDEITSGAVTFCSRTILAIVVALSGMLVGGLVVLGRLLVVLGWCACVGPRTQAHVEMVVAIFLVLLFSATVALITGIGGPGQSVGDLYFSTWLSFAVALGIFVQCEAQVRKDKSLPSSRVSAASESPEEESNRAVAHPPVNGSVLV